MEEELRKLPLIPIEDHGGSGGMATIHTQSEPAVGQRFSITVKWPELQPVDMVVLVPARRYTAQGLDAQYGVPDEFEVELIDANGEVLRRLAREGPVSADPVRAGHPFVYQVDPPENSAGLRVVARRLRETKPGGEEWVHAWSEWFAFDGGVNLAAGIAAMGEGGGQPSAPWQWSDAFLTDGQTPLGLPELPEGDHADVGWLSEGRPSADKTVTLEIDLGRVRDFDRIRLFPAKRPTSDLPSGFGFPRKLSVTMAEQRGAGNLRVREFSLRNPGHNPVELRLEPQQARFLKLEATELWKVFEGYPAFLALSEIELLGPEGNVAAGAGVRSPDGMGNVVAPGARYWRAASLTDRFGPEGRIVPERDWLMAFEKRRILERKRHELLGEAARIERAWRNGAMWGLIGLIGIGLGLLVWLPIRYRVRERRELERVRERIAGDLHDEVGSNLGSIQMFADLAEGRSGPSDELKRIQRIAAETVSAVRDIVWLLRPHGAHRIGTAEHLRETASIMLEPLQWQFLADEEAWQVELNDEASRNLFLYYREALHNLLRHSKAKQATIHVSVDTGSFLLRISDDGMGIPEAKLERASTLRALRQRAEALAANFTVDTSESAGTKLNLSVPIELHRARDAAGA